MILRNTILLKQMDLKTAIEILEYYQEWRLGKDCEQPNPKLITKALQVVLTEVKKQNNGKQTN